MKIIIPMSGFGSRFQNAGFLEPKPLIKVHNMPIIWWVCQMFPKDIEIIFICQSPHLENTNLADVLNNINPNNKIIAMEPKKLGPVYAVSKAFNYIDNEEDYFITYCDYYMDWDYNKFLKNIHKDKKYDAGLPCYDGFHPHLVNENNLYATCLVKNDQLLEIKEKHRYHNNPYNNITSPGMFYFSKGEIIKKYFQKLMDKKMSLNGEYYISMVYQLMLKDNLNIFTPRDVKYFCQWGTPLDLSEYEFYVNSILYNKEGTLT